VPVLVGHWRGTLSDHLKEGKCEMKILPGARAAFSDEDHESLAGGLMRIASAGGRGGLGALHAAAVGYISSGAVGRSKTESVIRTGYA